MDPTLALDPFPALYICWWRWPVELLVRATHGIGPKTASLNFLLLSVGSPVLLMQTCAWGSLVSLAVFIDQLHTQTQSTLAGPQASKLEAKGARTTKSGIFRVWRGDVSKTTFIQSSQPGPQVDTKEAKGKQYPTLGFYESKERESIKSTFLQSSSLMPKARIQEAKGW